MTAPAQRNAIGTDFTQGEVMPLLLRFFLPFLLANLLNSIYNTVDTIIIGQFVGSSGIVAVTMGGKMLNLFTNIGLAFAGGGQVLISQLVGAKRREEINATIGTLFSEMLGLSVIFAAVTLLLSKRIITWLNTPEEAFESAVVYLRITCVGLPLIFGYNAVSSVLRGMGDSKSPLVFIAIAAFINLVGDLVLSSPSIWARPERPSQRCWGRVFRFCSPLLCSTAAGSISALISSCPASRSIGRSCAS